jgi:hypothetical protein
MVSALPGQHTREHGVRMRVGSLAVAVAMGTLLGALDAPATGAQEREVARFETIVDTRSLPREVSEEIARTWNASGTLRTVGVLEITADRSITSDVVVVDGPLTIAGRVTGRVMAVNADVIFRPGATLDGSLLVVGGRLDGRDSASVTGDIRIYSERAAYRHGGGGVIGPSDEEDDRWWRRRERWRSRSWSDLRLVSARTYNRVEGLPVIVGPAFGQDLGWGRLTIDALGIIRSADDFRWTPENIGHTVKGEIRFGYRGGIRLGGRHFDVVDAVESWQLSDSEVGLASFFLHRDYRDYFDRHGATVYGAFFAGSDFDVTVGYSDQRWGARSTRDPFTLFRNQQGWRLNPSLDDGRFHLVNAMLRYDSRNDEANPWSGWYVVADYEFGTGTITSYGPTSPLVRDLTAGGETEYDRLFIDVRRYNRVSPDGQLNLRLVVGGWLSGDELPLQRRFSVGGPGTLPGFDFRRTHGNEDRLQCSQGPDDPRGIGSPAQCERMALAQIEYRGDIRIDPFGVFDEERDRRRRGWGRGAQWVVFADAGRGWLVGPRSGAIQFPKGKMPSFDTFESDIGIGLQLDELGLFLAKSLSGPDQPANFFVRLRSRF